MAKKLGYLAIYTIPSGLYNRSDIEQAFKDNGWVDDKGSPQKYMPTHGDPGDKFRVGVTRAVNEFAKKHKKDALGRRLKIKATDVQANEHLIQKDVTQEVVRAKQQAAQLTDKDGEQIDLDENKIESSIAKIVWRHKVPSSKVEDKIRFSFEGSEQEWAPGVAYGNLMANVVDTVTEMMESVTDVQLRAAVRKIVEDELLGRDASPVRGTLFIPAKRGTALGSLVKALKQIDPNIFAAQWTLYDEGSVREDMATFIEGDMQKQIEVLIDEIKEAAGAGAYVKSNKMTRLKEEIAMTRRKVSIAYAGLVDEQRVAAMLATAEAQVKIIETNNKIAKEKEQALREAEKLKHAEGLDVKVPRKKKDDDSRKGKGLFGEKVPA